MAKPFKGVINVDIRDSEPDWSPFEPPKAPDGAPNVLYIVLDDVGYSAMSCYGGPIETPNIDRIASSRRPLHAVPHDRAVLADALVPADRTQPHAQQHGLHHRGGDRLSQRERHGAAGERDALRDPRRAGVEHVHGRQVAPVPDRRDESRLDAAQLAERPRLRALVRVPRRRDEPVVSGSGLRQPSGRSAEHARGGLSPHRGHHRQGARVHQGRQGGRAGEAVLPATTRRAPATRRTTRRRSGSRSSRAASTWAMRRMREQTLARQKELGIVPADTELPPVNPIGTPETRTSADGKPFPEIDTTRPWDSLNDEEKRLFARMAEVYAGFLGHADHADRARARLPRAERAAREHDGRRRLRQRRQRRGRPERLGQRDEVRQRRPRRPRRRTSRRSTSSAARRPTTTIRPAGRWRSTRRSRCGSATSSTAERPTRASSPGRPARRRGARSASSTTTRSTSSRRSSTRSASSAPETVKGHVQIAVRRGQHARQRRRRLGAVEAQDAVLLDARLALDLARRLEGGDHASDDRRLGQLQRRRVGAVQHRRRSLGDQQPRRRAAREAAGSSSTSGSRRPARTARSRSTIARRSKS